MPLELGVSGAVTLSNRLLDGLADRGASVDPHHQSRCQWASYSSTSRLTLGSAPMLASRRSRRDRFGLESTAITIRSSPAMVKTTGTRWIPRSESTVPRIADEAVPSRFLASSVPPGSPPYDRLHLRPTASPGNATSSTSGAVLRVRVRKPWDSGPRSRRRRAPRDGLRWDRNGPDPRHTARAFWSAGGESSSLWCVWGSSWILDGRREGLRQGKRFDRSIVGLWRAWSGCAGPRAHDQRRDGS